MPLASLLVANRGEIAIRILRAAHELGIRTVAVYAEDDAAALHTQRADAAVALRGTGAAAYLDIGQIIAAAQAQGCDAIHPGYGFLSENAELARRCAEAGIGFVGPEAATLAALGDKTAARDLAERLGVPLLRGTRGGISPEEARAFLTSLDEDGALMLKAVAGGGGRGMRAVRHAEELEEAFTRCRSEALAAFGNGDLYAEERLERARHVEVQVIGDGSGAVSHLWERECSLQRRHQKLVEIAPCPSLTPTLREHLTMDAVRMAQALRYRGLGTFEFLVDTASGHYAFIEANARLQVEHTVTEEVLDLDLVRLQLLIAGGDSLADLSLGQADIPRPHGYAIQLRINMEVIDPSGAVRPSSGTISVFEPPSGRGIRVDSCAYAGYTPSPNFDSLLAKLICHSPSPVYADAVAKAYRALCELRVEGVRTNAGFLQNLLQRPELAANAIHTGFVEAHLAELAAGAAAHPRLYFEAAGERSRAGATVDAADPLAVLAFGKSGAARPSAVAAFATPAAPPEQEDVVGPDGTLTLHAPMQATIVSIDVGEGELVRRGQQALILNAMKMEHVIAAPVSGVVLRIEVAAGEAVWQGAPLLLIEAQAAEETADETAAGADLDVLRPDLAAVERMRALTRDDVRPEAVARRHATGHRTMRENLAALLDPDSFVEYGPLTVAPGLVGSVEERLAYAPSDGMATGIGQVNRELFGPEASRCAVAAYDYTVLAGTQGGMNHRKKDRIFQVAERLRVPVVIFAEGGGGRAGGGSRNNPNARGGVDATGRGEISGGGGLAVSTWTHLGRLKGLVPVVGITAGRCFAGNAALLGLCDVIIATADANIGMGGPAMVEGGGLGVFAPEEIGPVSVQAPNGVIDIAVKDEVEAVAVARQYLSYFQGRLSGWQATDQRPLRTVIPENRLRVYNVRSVIETLADAGTALELRRGFGLAMVTSLIRIEGRPVGVVANNPQYLSGAIDSDAADKAARFMQLCDAFGIPILFLCDTPGIMVGPEVEKTAIVRHSARMWAVGTSVHVPTFTVVLRKAYGLGAQAMGGGNHKAPVFTIAWPTGEFGGMGLEGQVKLGYRRELEAIDDPEQRRRRYTELVDRAYERGKALNAAFVFEVEDVIDPADTRRWLAAALEAAPPPAPRERRTRRFIDTW